MIKRIITIRVQSRPYFSCLLFIHFLHPFCQKPHTVCGFTGMLQSSLPSSKIVILTICPWACSMFHLISALNSYAAKVGAFTALYSIYKMPSATWLCSESSVSHGEHLHDGHTLCWGDREGFIFITFEEEEKLPNENRVEDPSWKVIGMPCLLPLK